MYKPEIERKWLVKDDGWDNGDVAGRPIEQGYFEDLRIRSVGEEYFLTIKRGKGLVKREFEVYLTEADFNRLWPFVEAKLTKVRYAVQIGDYVAEVDLYEGPLKGLETVEVEFEDEEEAMAFEPPPWFGEEVTNDERYSNYSLAWEGCP